MTIPGFTSTGSKRPDLLFGTAQAQPQRMVRARGCRVWDENGNEYVDFVMALGAVGLGYAHPHITEATVQAIRDGSIGSLAPVREHELAERLASVIAGAEASRFLKSGAEAVAAAVRIARVHTGRERVVTCGYHGWFDWCHDAEGVPEGVSALRREVPFNDIGALERTLEEFGPVAALVLEPVVDGPPDRAWLDAARRECRRLGTVLIFDEIKTAFRIALGGAAERYGIVPDLTVVGKALGNGFPIAAVCGQRALMDAATRTWISSTLATEYVGLAAALAVIEVFERDNVIEHLERVGQKLMLGFGELAARHSDVCSGVAGVPQMCYLQFRSPESSAAVARAAARGGILFKRTAYNFVSLAHTDSEIDQLLEQLDLAMIEAGKC